MIDSDIGATASVISAPARMNIVGRIGSPKPTNNLPRPRPPIETTM